MAETCVAIAQRFQVEGHRGDYVLALAARAHAARRGASVVEAEDLLAAAPLALQHRRAGALQGGAVAWSDADTAQVAEDAGASSRSPAAP